MGIVPAWKSNAPLQPNRLTSTSEIGASRKAPIPDPQTAIPVASARHLSK